MNALILAPTTSSKTTGGSLALVDVAGRPLLARQIQWLHAVGCDEVVVESGGNAEVEDFIETAARRYGPTLRVVRGERTGPLATRIAAAGIATCGPTVVLPACMLGDGDLTRVIGACAAGGAVVRCAAPPLAGARSGAVRIWMPGEGIAEILGPGWAIAIRSADEAWALGWAALEGTLATADEEHLAPIEIHGAAVSHGVFVARGARISRGATIHGPAFIGAGAYVASGATVGPNAVLGAHSVVLGSANVRGEQIAARAIIGADRRAMPFATHASFARALLREWRAALVGLAAAARV